MSPSNTTTAAEVGTNAFDIVQQMLADIEISVNQKKKSVVIHKIAYAVIDALLKDMDMLDSIKCARYKEAKDKMERREESDEHFQERKDFLKNEEFDRWYNGRRRELQSMLLDRMQRLKKWQKVMVRLFGWWKWLIRKIGIAPLLIIPSLTPDEIEKEKELMSQKKQEINDRIENEISKETESDTDFMVRVWEQVYLRLEHDQQLKAYTPAYSMEIFAGVEDDDEMIVQTTRRLLEQLSKGARER